MYISTYFLDIVQKVCKIHSIDSRLIKALLNPRCFIVVFSIKTNLGMKLDILTFPMIHCKQRNIFSKMQSSYGLWYRLVHVSSNSSCAINCKIERSILITKHQLHDLHKTYKLHLYTFLIHNCIFSSMSIHYETILVPFDTVQEF